jgi:hypothetical protein
MGAVAYYGYGASATSQANKPAFSAKPAPPDGCRPRMASPCIRFVQPCRADAGVIRPNRTQPPASGSASEGRRGLFNTYA